MSDKPRTDWRSPSPGPDENEAQQQSRAQPAGQMHPSRGGTQADDTDQPEGASLKPVLERAKHALEDGVERQARHLQDRARNTGDQISEALGAAARTLRSDESWLAAPAQDLAQSVRRLTARGLGSPAEMKQRITDFARQHPAWALAGAVAIGFAAARFLKTGSNSSAHDEQGASTDDRQNDDFAQHQPEEAGLAERPEAVPGAPAGGSFHG